MNEYKYEDIYTGQKESFKATVTEEMFACFCSITGDSNPLHGDGEYAESLGYSGRVAYGMLTASFLSTLAGVYLPGKYSLIHEVSLKLTAPVYIGDELMFEGEVIEKNDLFNLITLKVTSINQSGEKVLRGNMKIGVSQ